jgi:hypothetical protein
VVTLNQGWIATRPALETSWPTKPKRSVDTVKLEDPDERATFTEQELDKARARRRKVVADLQRQGLIDPQGKRVKKEMPPDMQPSQNARSRMIVIAGPPGSGKSSLFPVSETGPAPPPCLSYNESSVPWSLRRTDSRPASPRARA